MNEFVNALYEGEVMSLQSWFPLEEQCPKPTFSVITQFLSNYNADLIDFKE
jgi:hypothetical protein